MCCPASNPFISCNQSRPILSSSDCSSHCTSIVHTTRCVGGSSPCDLRYTHPSEQTWSLVEERSRAKTEEEGRTVLRLWKSNADFLISDSTYANFWRGGRSWTRQFDLQTLNGFRERKPIGHFRGGCWAQSWSVTDTGCPRPGNSSQCSKCQSAVVGGCWQKLGT